MALDGESTPREENESSERWPKAERDFPLDRVAVIASGSGSTFEAIASAVQTGEIEASHLMLVTDKGGIGAIKRAGALGVPHVTVYRHQIESVEQHTDRLARTLVENQVGLVFLAGYMRQIGPRVLDVYERRILNTHPALLGKDPEDRPYGGPGMFGRHVHEAVFANQDPLSGASVHLVDANFDHGPIVRRAAVNVDMAFSPDEIGVLVQRVEKPLVVSVLRDVLNGTIDLSKF